MRYDVTFYVTSDYSTDAVSWSNHPTCFQHSMVYKGLELEEANGNNHFIKTRTLLSFSLLYCKNLEHYLASGRHSTSNYLMNEVTQYGRCLSQRLALVRTK